MTRIEEKLDSGTVTGEMWGEPGLEPVICLPGFSQDERSFGFIAPQLAEDRQVAALALRGRGHSVSAPGAAWGPAAHARDVIEIAGRLGWERFTLMGWSFGALVTMHVADTAPQFLTHAVLIDAAGKPDEAAMVPVAANQVRLTQTFPDVEAYVETAFATGMMAGHEDWFRPYLAEDLVEVEGGFRTRTTTVIAQDSVVQGPVDPAHLWPSLTMPVLLLPAARPIGDGGFIVPESERDAFLAAVPTAESVDIDANHGTIAVVQESVDAIRKFLAVR